MDLSQVKTEKGPQVVIVKMLKRYKVEKVLTYNTD